MDQFQTEGCVFSSGRKIEALSKRVDNLESQVKILQQNVAASSNANSHSNNGGNQGANGQQSSNKSSRTT